MELRDKLAEIIRNAHFTAHPMMQYGYPEADALIQAGVILPPCKVGDTVYQVSDCGIEKEEVLSVGNRFYLVGPTLYHFCASDIGETVFLTREDAEAAWKSVGRRRNDDKETYQRVHGIGDIPKQGA